jgi:hypothetical protein
MCVCVCVVAGWMDVFLLCSVLCFLPFSPSQRRRDTGRICLRKMKNDGHVYTFVASSLFSLSHSLCLSFCVCSLSFSPVFLLFLFSPLSVFRLFLSLSVVLLYHCQKNIVCVCLCVCIRKSTQQQAPRPNWQYHTYSSPSRCECIHLLHPKKGQSCFYR